NREKGHEFTISEFLSQTLVYLTMSQLKILSAQPDNEQWTWKHLNL
ncbi:46449_t:CDS:1, partial [Gigaspora margarita]